jgi:hypothetical protein
VNAAGAPEDTMSMPIHPHPGRAAAPVLAALLLAGCAGELPKDRGVWWSCNVSIHEESLSLPGQPNSSIEVGQYNPRVCANPTGVPESDILDACVDQCEDDLSTICVGLDLESLRELFLCGPDCAAISALRTGEDCRNASIVPGPPMIGQAEVTLDGTSRATVTVEGEDGVATPAGFIRYSRLPCATSPCPFSLAAFRFTTPDFEIDDEPIRSVLVQSAGEARGTIDASGHFVIGPGLVRVSVNFVFDGEHGSITLTNSDDLEGDVDPVADTFRVAGSFSQDNVAVNLSLSGSHTNRQPVAAFSPAGPTIECTGPQGAAVTLQSTATDPDGPADIVFQRWHIGEFVAGTGPQLPFTLPFGSTAVGLGVADAVYARDARQQTLTVVDTRPPLVTAPPDSTVECAAPAGTPVPLGAATATDVCDPALILENDAPAVFGLGTTTVTWTARDDAGNAGSATQRVRIVDTTPPDLTVTLSPAVLFPPVHKLVPIIASITVRDVCDADATARLVSITSNEPDEGLGDGNHPGDIQEAALDTDDRSFLLRAERSGRGAGRVYTVTYEAADASGNTTRRQATVTVPKSQGR